MATVLIIDDSDSSRVAIRRALRGAGEIDRVLEAANGMQGLKLLLSETVDVVLCDLEMPDLDGEKLLRVKNTRAGGADVPFLVLTASVDMDRRARLLEDGASDAVTKPFHPPDLLARVRLHLKIKKLQDELRVKNETLARLSTTDAVTGLRTRRYVSEALRIEFLRASRYDSPLTVMMADIDHFKRVNDDFGHPVGDAALRGVADTLAVQLRATDVAGRFGGEEFLVVLPQSGIDGGSVAAERWRQAVEMTTFEGPEREEVCVTISIGVATYAARFRSPDQLVAAADAALYLAKDAGRNRVVAPPAPSDGQRAR